MNAIGTSGLVRLSQYGSICPLSTFKGEKCGLVKSITIFSLNGEQVIQDEQLKSEKS